MSVCDIHLCTCARARTHTRKCITAHKHTQMPHRRSPSQTRTLSLCCCQIKAWKAGHKGDKCVAAARDDTRTAAKQTADQMRVLKMLEQLDGAADWRGMAAQERAARALAAAVRTSLPSKASSTVPSETRMISWGTMRRPSSTTRRAFRLQRSWATGRGVRSAGRTRTSGLCMIRRGPFPRP